MRADRRWAGRNAISSGDVGTVPVHGATVNVARLNAAAPCSLMSFSISAPVPPGYGWNVHDTGSPLPSGGGGAACGGAPLGAPPAPCANTREPKPKVVAAAVTSE